MPPDTAIDLPSTGETIAGLHPIVIIGPNGSGKTRFASSIPDNNDAEFVSARRDLSNFSPDRRKLESAQKRSQRHKNRSANQPWGTHSVFKQVLTKVYAEDEVKAREYRDKSFDNPNEEPEETTLTKVREFWNTHFPQRSLNLESHNPKTINTIRRSEEDKYNAERMSDGEKVALYLALRVFDASTGIIVVDEPVLHLHSVLARKLWDSLEDEKSDCRFVYVTHNLPFALSRREAQFIIMEPDGKPRVLPREENIPEEVVEDVYGAATFSVTSSRIVFCEGDDDLQLYETWFDDNTSVVEVGGCNEVEKSVEVINSRESFENVTAIGIIDRDHHSDFYIDQLPPKVHVLETFEYESLMCLPNIFEALQSYFQGKDNEIGIEDFEERIRQSFVNVHLTKVALERAKERIIYRTENAVTSVTPSDDNDEVEMDLKTSVPESLNDIFREELEFLRSKRDKDLTTLLKYVPGRMVLEESSNILGVEKNNIIDKVIDSLKYPDDDSLSEIRAAATETLSEHLPPRATPESSPDNALLADGPDVRANQ